MNIQNNDLQVAITTSQSIKKTWGIGPVLTLIGTNNVNGGAAGGIHEHLITKSHPLASIGHPSIFHLTKGPKTFYSATHTKHFYHS